jgi:1-acyl-sn-glycerol-3-phosphate acyltransferase
MRLLAFPLRAYHAFARRLVQPLVGRVFLPRIMRRALRTRLAGVWEAGEPAPYALGGVVLAANHHSWWDTYLGWGLGDHHGRTFAALMDDTQLTRFPFFRQVGAISTRFPRVAARRAAEGAWLLVFVEGGLQSPGGLRSTREGASALARWAGTPIQPVAMRVMMRGADQPEAYLRWGPVLPSGSDHDAVVDALRVLLERVDRDIASAENPEAPVPGYQAWWPPRHRDHERKARWQAWWGS